MCGIVAIKRYDGNGSASKMTLKRYRNQKSRGSEGFGFLAIKDGLLTEYIRTETETDIVKHLEDNHAPEIIFHHRFPTSTPNFAQASHPIKVSSPLLKHDYYMIHNGVIWNDKALKAKHEALGFKYTTELVHRYESQGNTIFENRVFNDSEALAIELAMDIDKDGVGIDVTGSIAFVVLQLKKNTQKTVKMFFGRNEGSPLKIEKSKGSFIAITSAGNGEMIPTNVLFSIDEGSKEIESREYLVGTERTSSYVYGAMGFHGINDYNDDYMPNTPRGFKSTAEVLDDQDEYEYQYLKEEYTAKSKKLAKMIDWTTKEAQELQSEIFDLESELSMYAE